MLGGSGAAAGSSSKSPVGGDPPGSVAAERPVWALRTYTGGAGGHVGRTRRAFPQGACASRPCRGNISVCWPSWSLIRC